MSKSYNDLLQHAMGVQSAQSEQGLIAEQESRFIDGVETMDILERKEKTGLDYAMRSTLLAEAIGAGVLAGGAMLTCNADGALSVLGVAAATAITTVGYKAIRNYLISKKYAKERNALAQEYQEYLDSKDDFEMTREMHR